jgi:hypothetical protein
MAKLETNIMTHRLFTDLPILLVVVTALNSRRKVLARSGLAYLMTV